MFELPLRGRLVTCGEIVRAERVGACAGPREIPNDRLGIGTRLRPVLGTHEKGTAEQQSRFEAIWMCLDRCACVLDRGVDFAFGKMKAGEREPCIQRVWIQA